MPSVLLRPLAWLALQAQLVLLALMSTVWNLVALVLLVLPAAKGRAIGRAGISRGYGLYWWVVGRLGMLRIDATVLDALADERGLIVVANHPSMLDALLLVSRLPRSACIMKASLLRNPFLGPGARLARYISNETPHHMVREAVRDLRNGGQLVLFPEGTRTVQQPINPFRPGFTLIAKLAKAPIQTVFIDTDSPYLGKGWPIWKLPPLPIRFSVRMGRRFQPTDDPAALLAEIERYIAAGVRGGAST